ncbi:MAG: hypothetical protein DRQ43_10265 [Gammaproteobacteria bacterium]|nr:MAG: hypothetical protein DRQ43_10265 [Gammaproteobacteria bacterium]
MVSDARSIASEITSTAKEEGCDLIVMGWALSEAMGCNVIRKILQRSMVPIFIVPCLKE